MKALFFAAIILTFSSFGYSSTNFNPQSLSNCPAPTNVSVTSQTPSSVSFDWDDCGCELTEYRTFWVKAGQASGAYATTSSNYSYTGLSAGTYQFHFYTVCGDTVSSIIIDEVVIS